MRHASGCSRSPREGFSALLRHGHRPDCLPYLACLWLRRGKPVWLSAPAAASLAMSGWLPTMHEMAVGRVRAAYGGVYIGVAIGRRGLVDGVRLRTGT
ncbi:MULTISPECIES: hypothetical protein [Desulfovibrionaceae]|uniref:hypothetical protein n=1 Tax=Nitratidesulfovibrio sp. SRB-5 TaxID=2872636 RepID=UPI00167D589C|nr:hypothetical protein [Nitratidesulfovibrio sp. SRB-5]